MTSQNKSIDVSFFENALRSLEEALKQEKTVWIRDATIQRFEYTFELAIRMMKRYFQEKGLEEVNVDSFTYRDLCRMAAEAELITEPVAWFDYREKRNVSSHAYDEEKAEAIYAAAKRFLPDAQRLLEALKRKI